MNNEHEFHSRLLFNGPLPPIPQDRFKHETMLFKCNYGYARQFGGECTHAFLDALGEDWKKTPLLIDSRVHMLMPGFYPCIPGWHHDDVPRDRADGQPLYPPRYKSRHAFAIWGDASITEFATGKAIFNDVPLGKKVYRKWHDEVEEKIARGHLSRQRVSPAVVYEFDWQTWHRGMKAHKFGWRFFIRATRDSLEQPANEIRRQTQVYLENTNEGW